MWPRLDSAEHIGAIACAKRLEDSFRLSVEALIRSVIDV
jgi:hypothetical protein